MPPTAPSSPADVAGAVRPELAAVFPRPERVAQHVLEGVRRGDWPERCSGPRGSGPRGEGGLPPARVRSPAVSRSRLARDARYARGWRTRGAPRRIIRNGGGEGIATSARGPARVRALHRTTMPTMRGERGNDDGPAELHGCLHLPITALPWNKVPACVGGRRTVFCMHYLGTGLLWWTSSRLHNGRLRAANAPPAREAGERMSRTCRTIFVLAMLCVGGEEASAQFNAPAVAVYIPAGIGGGYDAYARLASRHLGRFLPGNPAIVPRNMPGAGGAAVCQLPRQRRSRRTAARSRCSWPVRRSSRCSAIRRRNM